MLKDAADAVVDGDLPRLLALLRADPTLIHARSSIGATLLHYVSANGVEDERQRTPANAVLVARTLLDAGADPNARSNDGSSTLEWVVSSVHPARAGLQIALAEALLDGGAEFGSSLRAAVRFGYSETAAALAKRGAPIEDAVVAAALGRLDLLNDMPLAGALISASMHGQLEAVRFLVSRVALAEQDQQGFTALHWACFKGHRAVINVLLENGAPLEIENAYGGTVLDATVWAARNTSDGVHYPPIVAQLLAAGADAKRVSPYPTGDRELDDLLSTRR